MHRQQDKCILEGKGSSIKPVRLAISLFVIELFIIFWIWLRYDDSFNPKAFVAIACISAVVFIAIASIIVIFSPKRYVSQDPIFKEMFKPEDFLPKEPAQDKDATNDDAKARLYKRMMERRNRT